MRLPWIKPTDDAYPPDDVVDAQYGMDMQPISSDDYKWEANVWREAEEDVYSRSQGANQRIRAKTIIASKRVKNETQARRYFMKEVKKDRHGRETAARAFRINSKGIITRKPTKG